MSNRIEYNELYTFHPGYYIFEIIEDMKMSQAEFAIRMGTTPKTISKLVNGQCNLSDDLAQKLSVMLGTSIEVWLNLQTKYNKEILVIEREKALKEQQEIMKMIDYSYFINNAGLPATKDIREKITNLCKYLVISNLSILKQPDFLVSYRTGINNVKEKNLINSQAWLQVAINHAKQKNVSEFNTDKLKKQLRVIRQMTTQEPEKFLPNLTKIFSDCGIAFVLLPHLKNSGIHGAVKWFDSEHVMLALNDRRCYADTFWFSLFHEIGHIFQQKVKTIFISGDDDIENYDQVLEREADQFAQEYLIPQMEYDKLNPTKYITEHEIVRFAQKIDIHPGVVVGRLQHDQIIPQNRLTNLKQKYQIVVN